MIEKKVSYKVTDENGIGSVKNTQLVRVNRNDVDYVAKVLDDSEIPFVVHDNSARAMALDIAEVALGGGLDRNETDESLVANLDIVMKKRKEIADNVAFDCVKNYSYTILEDAANVTFGYMAHHFTADEIEFLNATKEASQATESLRKQFKRADMESVVDFMNDKC